MNKTSTFSHLNPSDSNDKMPEDASKKENNTMAGTPDKLRGVNIGSSTVGSNPIHPILKSLDVENIAELPAGGTSTDRLTKEQTKLNIPDKSHEAKQ